MTAFNYIALNETGSRLKGILEADSARQVRQLLRDKGLTPLQVAGARERIGKKKINALFARINARELALITRQLATLLQAGLPVEEGLAVVSRQIRSGRVSSVLLAIRARILEGHTLAYGLEEYAHVFPRVYRSTVAAGEQAGHLHEVLNRLADYTEDVHESRQRILLSLLYPLLLLVLSVTIVAGLMVYVVPDVIAVFIETGRTLPLLTRLLIGLSGFISQYGLVLSIVVLLFMTAGSFIVRQSRMRQRLHRLVLRVPAAGRFNLGVNCARFARTLNILFNSGVPLVEALTISGRVLSNQWLRQQVEEATQNVAEGSSLSAALEQSGDFPPMMVQMIASGEAGGELGSMLHRIAQDQEREIQALVRVGLGLLEPLMLLLMGGAVLFIVLAILLPIMNLNQLIS